MVLAQESFAQLKAQCFSLCASLQTDIKKEINEVISEMQKREVQNKATVRPSTPGLILFCTARAKNTSLNLLNVQHKQIDWKSGEISWTS